MSITSPSSSSLIPSFINRSDSFDNLVDMNVTNINYITPQHYPSSPSLLQHPYFISSHHTPPTNSVNNNFLKTSSSIMSDLSEILQSPTKLSSSQKNLFHSISQKITNTSFDNQVSNSRLFSSISSSTPISPTSNSKLVSNIYTSSNISPVISPVISPAGSHSSDRTIVRNFPIRRGISINLSSIFDQTLQQEHSSAQQSSENSQEIDHEFPGLSEQKMTTFPIDHVNFQTFNQSIRENTFNCNCENKNCFKHNSSRLHLLHLLKQFKNSYCLNNLTDQHFIKAILKNKSICNECWARYNKQTAFVTDKQLIKHLWQDHSLQDYYPCFSCHDRVYFERQDFIEHLYQCHYLKEFSGSLIISEPNSTINHPIFCSKYCGRPFSSLDELDLHMVLHEGLSLEQKAQYEVQRAADLANQTSSSSSFYECERRDFNNISNNTTDQNSNYNSNQRICTDKNAENCDEIITGKRKRGRPRSSIPQLPTIDDDQLSDASSDEFPDDSSSLSGRTISDGIESYNNESKVSDDEEYVDSSSGSEYDGEGPLVRLGGRKRKIVKMNKSSKNNPNLPTGSTTNRSTLRKTSINTTRNNNEGARKRNEKVSLTGYFKVDVKKISRTKTQAFKVYKYTMDLMNQNNQVGRWIDRLSIRNDFMKKYGTEFEKSYLTSIFSAHGYKRNTKQVNESETKNPGVYYGVNMTSGPKNVMRYNI